MRCCRKILHISYKDHVTNEEVRAKIRQAIGPHEDLLTIVKRRQGRQRKRWVDNIMECTGLEFAKSKTAVENREKWRKLVTISSAMPQRPSRLGDRWKWRWRWSQLCFSSFYLIELNIENPHPRSRSLKHLTLKAGTAGVQRERSQKCHTLSRPDIKKSFDNGTKTMHRTFQLIHDPSSRHAVSSQHAAISEGTAHCKLGRRKNRPYSKVLFDCVWKVLSLYPSADKAN